MLKSIPIANALTLGNLAAGLLAIPLAMNPETAYLAFFLLILAAVLDFFDGMAARALGQEGPLGQELDSLADLVSFGVVPGLMWKSFVEIMGYCPPTGFCINSYVWLFIPLAAAYRLARFNVQSGATKNVHFTGVPTPLTGLVLASFGLIYAEFKGMHVLGFEAFLGFPQVFFEHVYLWLYMPLLASFMMISDYTMFSLKFNAEDTLNPMRWLLISSMLIMVPLLGASALVGVYLVYLLMSFIVFRGKSNTTETT
jgi:CDP-diacylglycerol--serine O-phosphatidyltransferase